ncbi:type II toxin-antitoxin system RelE family toxin [Ectothiorhodospira mobilis]|uniref:type II toxin-antitoxin system RelE family toxin n=1 Tax=Ectothiorhodospira mobilis TaxID=195064 RepID=UPI000AEB4BF7|nr:type II toxin-antitoxin system RelE/ParE family toxin [Ectothiorhodospira mobilis]
MPTDRLSGYESVYKIKLRAVGYRLVYEVVDDTLIVYVLAVGKRGKGRIYALLKGRL